MHHELLKWHTKHGRSHFPWQHNISPYRVWLSEIMLQQTQTTTVINYFNNFTTQFPTIFDLAAADLDLVLNLWTGLGYYARARNLHKTAQIICSEYHGIFPETLDLLEELPGIGRSTAAAILSLAYNQKATILDGNVKRVLTRYLTFEGTIKDLWKLAENLTPYTHNAQYTQAIMDLGATICTPKNFNCPECPLQKNCRAYQTNQVDKFPIKKIKSKIPIKETYFLILKNNQNQILLEHRPPTGIWGGLWSFPEISESFENYFLEKYGYVVEQTAQLKTFTHVFTHFKLKITPIIFNLTKQTLAISENSSKYVWYDKDNSKLGLPQPVYQMLTTEFFM